MTHTQSSPLLQKEWIRMCQTAHKGPDMVPEGFPPMDVTRLFLIMQSLCCFAFIHINRYASPRPPPHLQKNITAWQQALDNANAQLEHLKTRADNLELTLHYGGNAWKVYNEKTEDYRKR